MAKKKLFIILLILVIGILWISPLKQFLGQGINWYSSLGITGAVFYVLTYAILASLMFPGSLITLAAGPIYGLWWGYVVVAFGSMGSVLISWAAGRYLLKKQVNSWMEKHPKFEALSLAISQRGGLMVMLIRLSPLFPFSLTNYLLSIPKIPLRTYLLASWVGMIPGTFAYVYIGYLGNEIASKQEQVSTIKGILLGAGLLATILLSILFSYQAKKSLNKILVGSSNS